MNRNWWRQEERTLALTELWAAGYSARDIAAGLGTTRNAIIGKVHRLALPNPEKKLAIFVASHRISEHTRNIGSKPREPYNRPQPHKPEAPEFLPSHRLRPTQSPFVFVRETGRVRDLPKEYPRTEILFIKRKSRQCAWPTSGNGIEMWCCGAQTLLSESYCADHHRRSRVLV